MAVYVTGDTHNDLDLQKIIDWDAEVSDMLTPDDYLIIAGDFGFPWDFSPKERESVRWLESRAYTVLFVDGNHERFSHWRDRPCETWHGGQTQRLIDGGRTRRLCRGEVFDLCGSSIFTLGGASSPDRAFRRPEVSWWEDELPSKSELEHAENTLVAHDWRVDYVVTHTCADSMLGAALYPSPGWTNPDHDRLTHFLEAVEDKLAYKRWYFGHFHRDADLERNHTVLYDEVVRLGRGVWG